MYKSTILIGLIFSFVSLAQERGNGPVRPDTINVEGRMAERAPKSPEKGEPGGASRDGGNRGGGGVSSGTRPASSGVLSPEEEAIFSKYFSNGKVDYSIYSKFPGYTYSRIGMNHKIESHIMIDVCAIVESNEKDQGGGLGETGRDALAQISGEMRGSANPTEKALGNKIYDLVMRDYNADKTRFDNHQKFISGNSPEMQEINRTIQEAQKAIQSKLGRYGRFSNFENYSELESAAFYTNFNISMSVVFASPYSRASRGYDRTLAKEISKEFLKAANEAIDFIKGYGHGSQKILVDTFNGVKEVIAYPFYAMKNPSEALESMIAMVENLSPSLLAAAITEQMELKYSQLNSGNAYVEGQAAGEIVANIMLGFLPIGTGISNQFFNAAKSSSLARTITSMSRSLKHLGAKNAKEVAQLFSRVKGPFTGESLLAAARKMGLKSKKELESFGLFSDRVLRNQAGNISYSPESVFADFSRYFKSFPNGYELVDVLNADELNKIAIGKGMQPPYLGGTMVPVVKITSKETFLRFHAKGHPAGKWVIKESEVAGMSAKEIKDYLNLPEAPTHVSKIDLNPGESVKISKVGKNDFGLGEGATQVEILRDVDSSEFYGTFEL